MIVRNKLTRAVLRVHGNGPSRTSPIRWYRVVGNGHVIETGENHCYHVHHLRKTLDKQLIQFDTMDEDLKQLTATRDGLVAQRNTLIAAGMPVPPWVDSEIEKNNAAIRTLTARLQE